jgi:hypothetical protein
MFAITMTVIGILLLGLFFLFGGHRSRLQGVSKETKLASDVAPEPLGETLDHAEQSSPTAKGDRSLALRKGRRDLQVTRGYR